MMDMFGKMQELQEKMEEMKKRLETIELTADAGEGAVKVTITASRKIRNVAIDPSLIEEGDTEQIEDLLVTAINRAIEQADQIHESEMQAIGGDLLPGLSGLME